MQLTIKERILPAEREWIGKVKIRIRKKCQSLCSDLLQDLEVNICWLWGSVVGGGGGLYSLHTHIIPLWVLQGPGVLSLYIHATLHCGYYVREDIIGLSIKINLTQSHQTPREG